ncbi:MAG: hypothetical protein R6V10_11090, partial [bacterium]
MSDKRRVMMIRPGTRFPRMGFAQPLGLLSLASVLRHHFPDIFDIKLLEQAIYDISVSELKERMEDYLINRILSLATSNDWSTYMDIYLGYTKSCTSKSYLREKR